MEEYLQTMLEGLKKKSAALAEILSISENQRTVIESELPFDGVREMIHAMNGEKQSFIQIVKDCDNMFEEMLKDIGPRLEAEQEMYAPQVKILQENIRKVMSLDVKIRVQEEENNQLLDKRRELPQQPGIKPKVTMPTNTAKVLNAYKQGKDNFKG